MVKNDKLYLKTKITNYLFINKLTNCCGIIFMNVLKEIYSGFLKLNNKNVQMKKRTNDKYLTQNGQEQSTCALAASQTIL